MEFKEEDEREDEESLTVGGRGEIRGRKREGQVTNMADTWR